MCGYIYGLESAKISLKVHVLQRCLFCVIIRWHWNLNTSRKVNYLNQWQIVSVESKSSSYQIQHSYGNFSWKQRKALIFFYSPVLYATDESLFKLCFTN